jgi:methylglutaconyl-CoA hydratase
LLKLLINASLNKEIKVIVLKSGGNRAFCAGASFEELIEIENIKSGIEFFLWLCQCYKCM